MVFLGTLVCMVPLFGGAWLITQGTVPLGITAVVLGSGGIDGGLSGVIRFEYDYFGSAVSVRFRSRSSSAF